MASSKLLFFALLLFASSARGQSPSGQSQFQDGPAKNGSASPRLQAIIQVSRDSIGANIVQVSLLDPNYSVATLQSQIQSLGTLTGSSVRGVQIQQQQIDPQDPKWHRLRALFAVDGLIDRKGAWVKIAPIVKAFAGTRQNPGLSNFQIDFDFERPTPADVGNIQTPQLSVALRQIDQSMEYTVLVKSLADGPLDVPDLTAARVSTTGVSPRRTPDFLAYATILIGISGVGALVYFVFLLKVPRKRSLH